MFTALSDKNGEKLFVWWLQTYLDLSNWFIIYFCLYFILSKGENLMKVRASVKPICEKCKIIKRKGRVRILCENPKHKQKQG